MYVGSLGCHYCSLVCLRHHIRSCCVRPCWQNERLLLENLLGRNRHRNLVQLHHALPSKPSDALRVAALAAVNDPAALNRVDWNARAVFLVTDFVSWTLRDALRVRLGAREAARRQPALDVQYEEYKWTIAVVSDVAEALLHLSRLDVMHLDISTKNITVAPYGHLASGVMGSTSVPHAVLIDFGSAVSTQVPAPLQDCTGNRQHLAPEVLEACAQQKRSRDAVAVDLTKQPVFELGVLAYEVARGGLHPLPGYPDTLPSWTDEDLPTLPDDFPPAFTGLLVTCVRCTAAQRPTLDAVVVTLRQLRTAAGLLPAYRLPLTTPWMRTDSPAVREAMDRCASRVPAVAAAETSVVMTGLTVDATRLFDVLCSLHMDEDVCESVAAAVMDDYADSIDVAMLPGVLLSAGLSPTNILRTVCTAHRVSLSVRNRAAGYRLDVLHTCRAHFMQLVCVFCVCHRLVAGGLPPRPFCSAGFAIGP